MTIYHPVNEYPYRDPAPEPAIELKGELVAYLDTLSITSDTIGDIRRSLFLPWDGHWNGWVREETAAREKNQ